MGAIFFRRCKVCNSLLRFEEKNKMEVKDAFCKTCRKRIKMQETKDI